MLTLNDINITQAKNLTLLHKPLPSEERIRYRAVSYTSYAVSNIRSHPSSAAEGEEMIYLLSPEEQNQKEKILPGVVAGRNRRLCPASLRRSSQAFLLSNGQS